MSQRSLHTDPLPLPRPTSTAAAVAASAQLADEQRVADATRAHRNAVRVAVAASVSAEQATGIHAASAAAKPQLTAPIKTAMKKRVCGAQNSDAERIASAKAKPALRQAKRLQNQQHQKVKQKQRVPTWDPQSNSATATPSPAVFPLPPLQPRVATVPSSAAAASTASLPLSPLFYAPCRATKARNQLKHAQETVNQAKTDARKLKRQEKKLQTQPIPKLQGQKRQQKFRALDQLQLSQPGERKQRAPHPPQPLPPPLPSSFYCPSPLLHSHRPPTAGVRMPLCTFQGGPPDHQYGQLRGTCYVPALNIEARKRLGMCRGPIALTRHSFERRTGTNLSRLHKIKGKVEHENHCKHCRETFRKRVGAHQQPLIPQDSQLSELSHDVRSPIVDWSMFHSWDPYALQPTAAELLGITDVKFLKLIVEPIPVEPHAEDEEATGSKERKSAKKARAFKRHLQRTQQRADERERRLALAAEIRTAKELAFAVDFAAACIPSHPLAALVSFTDHARCRMLPESGIAHRVSVVADVLQRKRELLETERIDQLAHQFQVRNIAVEEVLEAIQFGAVSAAFGKAQKHELNGLVVVSFQLRGSPFRTVRTAYRTPSQFSAAQNMSLNIAAVEDVFLPIHRAARVDEAVPLPPPPDDSFTKTFTHFPTLSKSHAKRLGSAALQLARGLQKLTKRRMHEIQVCKSGALFTQMAQRLVKTVQQSSVRAREKARHTSRQFKYRMRFSPGVHNRKRKMLRQATRRERWGIPEGEVSASEARRLGRTHNRLPPLFAHIHRSTLGHEKKKRQAKKASANARKKNKQPQPPERTNSQLKGQPGVVH